MLAVFDALSVTVTSHVETADSLLNTVEVNVGFDIALLLIVGVSPDDVDMWLHE